jgi:rhamnogalacturonan acetylesterase
MPANPKLPSLFLIGDSTVRNGQGTGTGGQWGWGDFLAPYFNTNKINVVNRARGTIKGVGDETRSITNLITHQEEVIHTFGWYEKNMINEARARGATPMVCSLIPRNNWKDGRVLRNKDDYAGWAGEVAAGENAPFLDINDIIADKYDSLGQEKVKPLFIVGAGPHTSMAGAQTNAMCVVLALKELKTNPLAPYFSEKSGSIMPSM